jgi:hypothetical protein
MEHSLPTWQQEFNHEMATGYSARASGLEGKSRVCARRALGIVIAEYFKRISLPSPGPSIQERISALKNLDTLPIHNLEIIDHFIIKVDEEYHLPIDVDLLAETTWLADQLLGKEQDEH